MERESGLRIDSRGRSSYAEQSATSAKANQRGLSNLDRGLLYSVCVSLPPVPSSHYFDINKNNDDRLCSLLGKRYRLEYMVHFDDCCKQLQRDEEYPTDSLLISLVGIRKIGMKVNNSFWEMIGNPNNQPSEGIYSIAVASIQNELHTFMNQLPANLKWNRMWFPLWKH